MAHCAKGLKGDAVLRCKRYEMAVLEIGVSGVQLRVLAYRTYESKLSVVRVIDGDVMKVITWTRKKMRP